MTSWAEVQQPFPQSGGRPPLFAYVLTYPKELPTGPAEPGADGISHIVAVDLTATVEVPGRPDTALDAVRYYSGAGQMSRLCERKSAVTCIRLGERTTFSVDFPVRVNAGVVEVPLGATLGTVAAMVAPDFAAPDIVAPSLVSGSLDPAAAARLGRSAERLRLWRRFDGRRLRVRFQTDNIFNFPLQPGDEIEW